MSKPKRIADFKIEAIVLLMVLVFYLATGNMVSVPLQFLQKDGLKLGPQQISLFNLLGDMPMWVGFAFGFLRDRWRPFQKGDTAYFLAAAVVLALTYAVLGFGPMSYGLMLGAMLVNAIFGAIAGAATQGVTAAVAKSHGMAGRLAMIWIVGRRLSIMIGSSAGGAIGEQSRSLAFSIGIVLALMLAVFAFLKPAWLYPNGQEPYESVFQETTRDAFQRLLRHKAIYAPALMIFLWDFAPGWGTPLFFYLTKQVHLTETQYGSTMSILSFGALISALAYPMLCRRINVRPLLIYGTLLGIVGGALFVLIHNSTEAQVFAALAGFSCGIATCTYSDVLFRSCPKELDGVVTMLFMGAAAFGGDVSDLVGSWLYDRGGFGMALVATCVTTAAILLFVPMIPISITKPMEGTPIEDLDAPDVVPIAAAS